MKKILETLGRLPDRHGYGGWHVARLRSGIRLRIEQKLIFLITMKKCRPCSVQAAQQGLLYAVIAENRQSRVV
jgi:hypothetical protein